VRWSVARPGHEGSLGRFTPWYKQTMSETRIVEFHQYSGWLREQSRLSGDWLVRASEDYLGLFFALDRDLPDRYGWRFTSVEAFAVQTEQIVPGTPAAHNRHYWLNTCRNLEA